jgi:hypothetical protein
MSNRSDDVLEKISYNVTVLHIFPYKSAECSFSRISSLEIRICVELLRTGRKSSAVSGSMACRSTDIELVHSSEDLLPLV